MKRKTPTMIEKLCMSKPYISNATLKYIQHSKKYTKAWSSNNKKGDRNRKKDGATYIARGFT